MRAQLTFGLILFPVFIIFFSSIFCFFSKCDKCFCQYSDANSEIHTTVIQYILFAPSYTISKNSNNSYHTISSKVWAQMWEPLENKHETLDIQMFSPSCHLFQKGKWKQMPSNGNTYWQVLKWKWNSESMALIQKTSQPLGFSEVMSILVVLEKVFGLS